MDEAFGNALAVVAAITGYLLIRRRRQRRERTNWRDPFLDSKGFSEYHTVMQQLREHNDKRRFQNFVRVSPDLFDQIVERVGPRVARQDTRLRLAIPVEQRIAIALRFVATGESYQSLEYHFRVSNSLISFIVPEVMTAIYEEYKDEYMKCPSTAEEWKEVAEGFDDRWQFPHTIGSLDGKHIRIKAPPKSGSRSYNYKGYFSFVLLGLVDSAYKFLYVNIGQPGSNSDGGIFNTSSLGLDITNNTAGLPNKEPLPNDNLDLSYHIIADDAFALREWMMKPFSNKQLGKKQQIFNYRLSRARRVTENAFGILAHRFRCLLSPLQMDETRAMMIVLGCCTLHNIFCELNEPGYLYHVDKEVIQGARNFIYGTWRNDRRSQDTYTQLTRMRGARYSAIASKKREYLMQYFCSPVGMVEWQERMVARQDDDSSDEEI